jgi:hypothetical protein
MPAKDTKTAVLPRRLPPTSRRIRPCRPPWLCGVKLQQITAHRLHAPPASCRAETPTPPYFHGGTRRHHGQSDHVGRRGHTNSNCDKSLRTDHMHHRHHAGPRHPHRRTSTKDPADIMVSPTMLVAVVVRTRTAANHHTPMTCTPALCRPETATPPCFHGGSRRRHAGSNHQEQGYRCGAAEEVRRVCRPV